MTYTIEIATDNYLSTAAAIDGGANRIEVCSALSEGGLTPSNGYLFQCRKDFQVPLFPIIRPRGGDFLYSAEEFEVIKKDVIFCRQHGFEGIVTGFLKPDGTVDKERMTRVIELAFPMQVTFHRAFDRCREPMQALEDIIDAGCHRLLTSGQKKTAPAGSQLIRQLVKAAGNRIIIMPGSGVRAENIAALARDTDAREFHSSLRTTIRSKMRYIHPDFSTDPLDYIENSIKPEAVQELFAALSTA